MPSSSVVMPYRGTFLFRVPSPPHAWPCCVAAFNCDDGQSIEATRPHFKCIYKLIRHAAACLRPAGSASAALPVSVTSNHPLQRTVTSIMLHVRRRAGLGDCARSADRRR